MLTFALPSYIYRYILPEISLFIAWVGCYNNLVQSHKNMKSLFKNNKEVELVYLFGSRATGRAGRNSDYDFAILLPPDGKKDYLKKQIFYMQKLEDQLHTSREDVLVLNEAPPRITHQVIKNGTVVFQKSDKTRVAFEVKMENMYLDEPYFIKRLTK